MISDKKPIALPSASIAENLCKQQAELSESCFTREKALWKRRQAAKFYSGWRRVRRCAPLEIFVGLGVG